MADGRKYRYDKDSNWVTFSVTVPILHTSAVEKAMEGIIAKGVYKFTIKNFYTSTSNFWFDTTYNPKIVTEALKDIPNIKINKM